MELIAGLLGSFGGIGGYLIAGLAAIAALFGYGAIKKRQGKSDADAANAIEQANRTVRNNSAVVAKQEETLKGTGNAQNQVTGLPAGASERELRDKWTRPE
ncbi:MAG: hypothetical protein JWR85_4193 [Marmoricola sp.]|nr:hypothetical protein [Marmoricola sp.]